MKIRGILFLFYLFPATLLAAAIGDADGLLKPASYQDIDQRVHQHLKQKIQIENPQPYTANEIHEHPEAYGCTKAVKHSHAAPRNHQHTYTGCRRHYRYSSPRPAPSPVAAKAAPQASTTNLQEQGVDEADYVKTDGRYLYAINNTNHNGGIRIYDTQYQGNKLKQISAIGFNKGSHLTGIYLLPKQQKLIAIGSTYGNQVRTGSRRWSNNTNLIFIDISNKTKPRKIRQVNLEGNPNSTRRIGNKLYLVLNSYSMGLPSTYERVETRQPMNKVQLAAVRKKITDRIEQWSVRDSLPHYREPGKPGVHSLIRNKDFYLNPKDLETYSLTTLLAIDLNAPEFRFQSLGWFGYTGTVYVSQKAMYVTSYFYADNAQLDKARFPNGMEKTLIHKFAFQNKGFDYRGSGAILGNLGWNKLSTFQLDESSKGTLHVVSSNWNPGSGNSTKDPATHSPVILSALAEHPKNKQLITLSRLPNKTSPKALGKPGEQLYGARLFDDYAYFVTFKRTDPLYVVDLRNPRRLKVTGELIIPGFSDYLHPLGDGLLLGVGKEAVDDGGTWAQFQGMKLSLFDVRNPNQPKEVHKLEVGKRGTSSPANYDHHAFTSLAMRGTNTTRVALPVSLVADEEASTRKDGLHRFEVDRKKRRIKHLGALEALTNNSRNRWSWSNNDRSIIIGDQLYYYHDGYFWRGNW